MNFHGVERTLWSNTDTITEMKNRISQHSDESDENRRYRCDCRYNRRRIQAVVGLTAMGDFAVGERWSIADAVSDRWSLLEKNRKDGVVL